MARISAKIARHTLEVLGRGRLRARLVAAAGIGDPQRWGDFIPIDAFYRVLEAAEPAYTGEEIGLTCDVCHEFYASGQHSGLPTLETCLGCHEDPQTESEEEQKIRDLAADGNLDVFRKLFKMPDHVFYSHRRHAEIGEVPCEACHGAVAATSAPPTRPLVRVSMDFCIECHEGDGVASECTTCHR